MQVSEKHNCKANIPVSLFRLGQFSSSHLKSKSHRYSVGAKSQILSSVAPPRKRNLVTIFSQGHDLGP